MKRTAVTTWRPCAASLLGAALLGLTAPPAAWALPGIKVSDLRITGVTRPDPTTWRAAGFFTITNDTDGGQAVQLERFGMAWQWLGPGGVRATCLQTRFQWTIAGSLVTPGRWIPGNTTVRVDYWVRCEQQNPPWLAREVKNFVAIKLVGRSKLFGGSGTFRLF
jgi:hypothetical protein